MERPGDKGGPSFPRAVRAVSPALVSELRVPLESPPDSPELTAAREEIARLRECLEAATRRAELSSQAEVANRTKDEFLAILGHELRNPLAPIVTALGIMRLRGVQSRELDVIERQVGHLRRLVDDLLDVSRITRGMIDLRRQPVELADVVLRAVETVGPLLEQRSHQVDVQVARKGLLVDGDPERLAQVISNLLNNAAKYSEHGSSIAIHGRRGADRVRLAVKDNGAGIAADMLEPIFDMFVQQPQTLERAAGGLGLGLAIARKLIEMHGGTLTARSAGAGKGSEFTIDLPALKHAEAKALDRSARARARIVPAAVGRRVLIVDDNRDAAETLREVLEVLGHSVEVAYDAPEALELTRRFRPEVALLDIRLPVIDGYELAEQLCELDRDISLVAITGYGQASDRERALASGFQRHLAKPVDIAELEQVIDELPR